MFSKNTRSTAFSNRGVSTTRFFWVRASRRRPLGSRCAGVLCREKSRWSFTSKRKSFGVCSAQPAMVFSAGTA